MLFEAADESPPLTPTVWTTLFSNSPLLLLLRGNLRTCGSIDIGHAKLPNSISQQLNGDGGLLSPGSEPKNATATSEKFLFLKVFLGVDHSGTRGKISWLEAGSGKFGGCPIIMKCTVFSYKTPENLHVYSSG
ncbi:hypothetical protein Y032_0004g1888 [Ancylostoma ceylanicum]|uniref:Uncharacterized protein n=1 Tax=Ancylostoma ceylanicum TaxID=53326 RepID=A0A016VW60_9BILA|nr:hypothetical protein Y032_0004g1888 [Ancylostoma ceylanicum]